MKSPSPILVSIAALAFWACGEPPSSEVEESAVAPVEKVEAWFEESAEAAGIDMLHDRGAGGDFYFPEIMSGGAAWIDVEGDGDLDLYFVQAGSAEPGAERSPNQLFRNLGPGEDGRPRFEDVTAEAGVGDTGFGMGAAVGDVDGDGRADLYVTNLGRDTLYLNQGEGRFEDATAAAGLGAEGWSASAAFLDFDRDGDLDLFVVGYVAWSPDREVECHTGAGQRDYCSPLKYNAPAPDRLYRNLGDGRFEDVTEELGLGVTFGTGLGTAVGDFDGDGRPEIYVANDAMPNQLWHQLDEGSFEDVALLAGAAVNDVGMAEAGMGVEAVDAEGDGDLDLFLSHLSGETNTLYLNHGHLNHGPVAGHPSFEDATARSGLSAASLPMTGFGVAFADFDHDGRLDLYVAAGRVRDPDLTAAGDPYAERDHLYHGLGPGRFEELGPGSITAEPLLAVGRAAALGDADGDGDLDLVVINNGGRPHLLLNQAGAPRPWLMLRLVDRRGVEIPGARVRLTAGGDVQWRHAHPAYGYLTSNDPRVHFGLGEAREAEEVLVYWPDGERESFGPLAAGAVHTVKQGTGSPAPEESLEP